MSKNFTLSISEPCHENWENMMSVEKGKFCGSCQKQVVDFTVMNDNQLIAFFKKPSNGSLCGRFMQDQLDREIDIPRKRIPWVKYFFQFALPAFLMTAKAAAQGKVRVLTGDTVCVPVTTPVEVFQGFSTMSYKSANEGKVVNERNEPIAFASIIFKRTGEGFATDSNGRFVIPGDLVKNGGLVEVSSAGYLTKEVAVDSIASTQGELTIQLLLMPALGEVRVEGYSSLKGSIMVGGLSVRTRKISRNKVKVLEPPVSTSNSLRLYPNPVIAGQSIHVNCEKLAEGYYIFRLLTIGGQIVEEKKILIDKKAGLLNITIPVVAAGNYFIKMTNKETGKYFTDKVIVQH